MASNCEQAMKHYLEVISLSKSLGDDGSSSLTANLEDTADTMPIAPTFPTKFGFSVIQS